MTRERELDLENLKRMKAAGMLEVFSIEDLEWLADCLQVWRDSPNWLNRQSVAWYGRDSDLDNLVRDPNPFVRAAVADRKRDKDLDILVNDPKANVRAAVAEQGRAKDLKKLINDKDKSVRREAKAKLINGKSKRRKRK